MVELHLAKVDVAGSSPVSRSQTDLQFRGPFFLTKAGTMISIDAIINNKILEIPDEIILSINKASKIVIAGHKDPDLDALGAQLALQYSLESIGKSVIAVNSGPFDNILIKNMKKYFQSKPEQDYDLLIVVDTPSVERASMDMNYIDLNKTIVIDHHMTNTYFGLHHWVDESFVSTCEMVYLLLEKLKINIGKKPAQHLLNGILADNGYFRHIRNDKSLSLPIVYLLTELEGNIKTGYDKLNANRSTQTLKLLSVILTRVKSANDGKIIYTYLMDEDLEEFQTNIDSGKVFEELMLVKGIEVAFFLKYDNYNKLTKISLRSTGRVNVAAVAARFGGGGHKVASGAANSDTIKNTTDKLLSILNSFIK